MFKDLGHYHEAAVRSHGPAELDHSLVVKGFGRARMRRPAPPGPAGWRARFEAWWGGLDLAPDLAEDIGSLRWLRGAGTCLGLSIFALSFWPDFSQVEAAAMVPQLAEQRDEYRSQMIMPLSFGGESGRHMGATPAVRPLSGVPERPNLQFVATLAPGDTFTRMLARAGVGEADAAQVAQLVGGNISTSAIPAGTQFDISLGQRPAPGSPRALQSLAFHARFDLDLTVRQQGAGLMVERHPIVVDTTPLRIRGMIGSSLYRSARNAGAPIGAIQAYLHAIDPHVSLESDLSAGDAFDFVIGYKRSATGERQLGDLLYAGIERAGKPRLQLLRWGKDGAMVAAGGVATAGFAQPEARSAIGAPVAGRITSLFGMRRHPILGFVRMHAGVDFGAAYGAPIYAVADGIVSFAGRHGGHGNYVRLEHGGGNGTGYGHMSRIAVFPGARVRAGQVIGYVGSSGLSTGPHLHFEAYQAGRTVNPLGLRFAAVRPQMVDPGESSAFKQRLAALMAIRPGAALGAIAGAAGSPGAGAHREINRLAMAANPLRHD